MRYPNIPPRTDPTEHTNAKRNHPMGDATTIAISSISGGIGKKEDSTNAMINKTGRA
jgi:hypothetical protein